MSDGRLKAIEMNPFEPPQTVDVSPRKPVKRMFFALIVLVMTVILLGVVGIGFWRATTAKKMAELFGVEIPTINYHLKEIFKSNELDESATIRKILIVQKEGDRAAKSRLSYFFFGAKMLSSTGTLCLTDFIVVTMLPFPMLLFTVLNGSLIPSTSR